MSIEIGVKITADSPWQWDGVLLGHGIEIQMREKPTPQEVLRGIADHIDELGGNMLFMEPKGEQDNE